MTPMYSVKECLRGYSADALGQMCDRWNLAISNPANRLRGLEKVLTDPLHVEKAVDQLTPSEIRILNLMSGRQQYPLSDILSVRALSGQGSVSAALQSLATWGFILVLPQEQHGPFSIGQLARNEQNGASTLALSVLDLIRGMIPDSPPLDFPLPSPTDEEPVLPSIMDGTTTAFLEALRIVDILGPRVTATGEVHKADATRARELSADANVSPDALGLAVMMGRQMGAMEAKGGRLVITARADRWSTQDPARRARDLFEAYLLSEELIDVHLFFPQLGTALEEHLPAGSLRRTYHKQLVAKLLACLHPGTWYTVDAFVDFVRRADPNLLFVEERWRAIAANAHDPSPAWRDRAWQAHEKRLIAWMIQSIVARLTMVETACEGRLFRLTPIGLHALGISDAPILTTAIDGDSLVVQPDFEVIAYLDKCMPDVQRKLDTFCERVRSGVVSTYRLTKDSVYRGLKTGVTLEAFIAMLEACSRRSLPENVIDQMWTWERKASSVTIHTNCRLIECLTPGDAAALAQSDSTARRIGDRFVLVQEAPEAARYRVSYAQAEHRCLVQDEGLRLRAPWADCSLFVRRRLQDIGEITATPEHDIVLTLTKERMRRDVDWGLQVAALETFVEKPLAARYKAALKTWSGETSPPTVHSATLIRFDDEEACSSVMELAQFSKFVTGRLGLYTVVLKPGALTDFKKALKAIGLSVDRNGSLLDDGSPDDWAVQWVESRRPAAASTEDAVKTVEVEKTVAGEDDTPLPSYSPRIMREIIEDAIQRRRTLQLRYKSTWSTKPSVRRVNPVSLDTVGAVPTLSGYCHRLGGARVFKLAQISGIRVLEDERF